VRTEQLKYFVAVAKYGSITEASKHLYMTQPALTLALKSLEKDLGLELFRRSKKGVVLTDAGQVVLDDSKVMLELENKWRSLSPKLDQTDEVKIVLNPCVYELWSQKLGIYAAKQKGLLQLICDEGKNQTILQQLINQEIDIGVISFMEDDRDIYLNMLEKSHLQDNLLYTDSVGAVIRSGSVLDDKAALEVTDFSKYHMAMYSDKDDNVSGPYFGKFFNERNYLRFNNLRAVLQSVLDLDTICFYPIKTIRKHSMLQDGRLITKPIRDYDKKLEYHLISKPEILLSDSKKHIKAYIGHVLSEDIV